MEFREFAARGNVIEMALGIIIRVAFGKDRELGGD